MSELVQVGLRLLPGVRAVVTALWDVNDLPAALLVCALYFVIRGRRRP